MWYLHPLLADWSVCFPLENSLSKGRIPTADECVQHCPGFWSLMDVLSLGVSLRPEMIFFFSLQDLGVGLEMGVNCKSSDVFRLICT